MLIIAVAYIGSVNGYNWTSSRSSRSVAEKKAWIRRWAGNIRLQGRIYSARARVSFPPRSIPMLVGIRKEM